MYGDEGYYGRPGGNAMTTTTTITGLMTTTGADGSMHPVPFVRVVKRRTTANKKERRRTQSINSAFTYLRDCIPNVPSDTKLSKVNYIAINIPRIKGKHNIVSISDKNFAFGHIVHFVFDASAGR